MYRLEKIEPGKPDRASAIFYHSFEFKKEYQKRSQLIVETDKIEVKSAHCELFTASSLKRVILNEKSFTLVFLEERSLKLYFKHTEQVKSLAGLIEHTIGGGCKVLEHFAIIEQNLTTKKE